MDHTPIVLFALLLNAVAAGPRAWVQAMGMSRLALLPARVIRDLERKLNREGRSAADRELRGWVVVAGMMTLSILLGLIGGWLFKHNLRFFEIVLVALLLPVRPIWDRTTTIRKYLAAADLPHAREMLAGTPWKHRPVLDDYGLARAAIEQLVVDFSEKLVCPVLGYVFFGLPGLFLCVSLTALRDGLLHAPEFGKAAREVQGWLEIIPSRVSAALWLATSLFLPSGDIVHMAKRVTDAFLQGAPRALLVRTAAAVARVSLGGPSSPYLTAWTDGSTSRALPPHIRRAQVSYLFAAIFLFVLTGVFF